MSTKLFKPMKFNSMKVKRISQIRWKETLKQYKVYLKHKQMVEGYELTKQNDLIACLILYVYFRF